MINASRSRITPPGLFRTSVVGVLATFVLVPSLGHPAIAGTAEGIAAFEAGNYERARAELKPEAEAGDAKAQLYIGRLYTYGYVGEKNDKLAFQWYLKAAQAGLPDAQVILGYAFDRGIGVEVNDSKAVHWYKKAALQGNTSAQFNLGLMYKEGEGVERDYKQAVKWFHEAAEKGDSDAQLELGIAYAKGKGVEQDYRNSAKWNKKAAAAGKAQAKRRLAWQYIRGEGVDEDLVAAAKLYRSLLGDDNPNDFFNLGRILMEKGRNGSDEYAFRESYQRFEQAAAMQHAQAMMYLGMCYFNGWGVERNRIEGVAWQFLSAEFGHGEAGAIWALNQSHMSDSKIQAAQSRADEIMRERGWSQ